MLSDFDMLAALAERFDLTVPDGAAIDAAVLACAARVPDFGLGDRRFASSAPPAALAPFTILSGGGTWSHDPSVATLRGGPVEVVGAPA